MGRLSDDGLRQHNLGQSEDPWGEDYPSSKVAHDRALGPTLRGTTDALRGARKADANQTSTSGCREQALDG
jgi:hypothetical protein